MQKKGSALEGQAGTNATIVYLLRDAICRIKSKTRVRFSSASDKGPGALRSVMLKARWFGDFFCGGCRRGLRSSVATALANNVSLDRARSWLMTRRFFF